MGLFNRKASKKNNTPPAPPPPPPPAMKVSAGDNNKQSEARFDANKFSYDVDTKTGLFYAVTFYHTYRYDSPAVTHVPYSKEVFELIPEGKREIYLEKFGDPEARETEAQKTLNLLLEQVAELTGRQPSQPAPRQQKKAEDGIRLRLG